jgi:hypothetical protein
MEQQRSFGTDPSTGWLLAIAAIIGSPLLCPGFPQAQNGDFDDGSLDVAL